MRSKNWSRSALQADWQYGGFGLYIHWPFCQAKCPYCDFNSHVRADIDQKQWVRAYISEIERIAAETKGRILDTVFFGGGTPSLMDPDTVDALMNAIRKAWRTSNSFEVTLEANPTSVEAGRFRGYRDAGVSRLSMGVQALNDTDLHRLGRLHTAAEAMKAFATARTIFDQVSFDLIYARQYQTRDAWADELRMALDLAVDHLSLYQLTIEDGTAFGRRSDQGRLPGLPTDDFGADLFELTQDMCETAGLPAYEVSNHARPDAQSQHNLIYWRYGDYAGIGPGAHGRLTDGARRFATDTLKSPEAWLEHWGTTGSGESSRNVISEDDHHLECLMMGLRLSEGVNLKRLPKYTGSGVFNNKIKYLKDLKLIKTERNHLIATPSGRMVLNTVLKELITD